MTTPKAPGAGGAPAGPSGTPGAPATVGGPDMSRATVTIANFGDYPSAQRAVDYLSDNKFPVEHSAIVGKNLSLVENVLGRMTTGRAALAGAASGAWFGLFIGLLFALFSESNWLTVVLTGLVVGALWGAVFGAIAHAATRGQRDFTSRSSLQATEYAIEVDADHADAARQLLTRSNWQASGAS
jgi:hypothetical protein